MLRQINLFVRHILRKADRTAQLSDRDRELMIKSLGITVPFRPAPSPLPGALHAANVDESQVNNFILPDPLVMKNGEDVNTPEDWWKKRRPEIVEDFEKEVYGRVPSGIPPVTWRVVSQSVIMVANHPVKLKRLEGWVDNSACPHGNVKMGLLVATPADATTPVPVVMKIGSIHRPFESSWRRTNTPVE